MQANQTMEPKLDKPGAGLPFFEWAFAKYVLMPQRFKTTDKKAAIEKFAAESRKIIALAEPLSIEQLGQRELIPRLRGLEDSSRYWSVAMTMQHLIIVGNSMQRIIQALSKGVVPPTTASTAAVKPEADVNCATIIKDFDNMTASFIDTVTPLDLDSHPDAKYRHPWFGPLTGREWLIFASPHQNIHRNQILEILKRLN